MINLLTSILMISAIGLSCPSLKVHDEYIDVNTPRLASYNDVDGSITLTAIELNYYTFTNLAELLNSKTSTYLEGTGAYYNNDNFDLEELIIDDTLSYVDPNYTGDVKSIYISLQSDDPDNFYAQFKYDVDGNIQLFNYSFTFDLSGANEGVYDEIKAAIELDIAANQGAEYSDLLVDILALLTGGLTTVAGALGSGITAYVNGLLIQNGAMSAFAATIFIFGGIALAFTLGRWVVNFISSLGNRNR